MVVPATCLMKQPLTEAEAVALGKRLGGIRELVAPKRRAEAEKVPDAKLAAWLAANPNFVRRPLIDTGMRPSCGRRRSAMSSLAMTLMREEIAGCREIFCVMSSRRTPSIR